MKRNRPPPGWLGLDRRVEAVTIIGLGGIGRQVAVQLTALGLPQLQLIDPRIVARVTQAAEGYAVEDTGRHRVHATAQLCHEINPQLEIIARAKHSLPGITLGDAVLCCPGSPSIWHALSRHTDDRTSAARCEVRGGTIHLEFARVAATLIDHLDADGSSAAAKRATPRSVVPIHITTLAAGLLAAEFLRFAAGDQAWRTIRFDVDTLRSNVEEPS